MATTTGACLKVNCHKITTMDKLIVVESPFEIDTKALYDKTMTKETCIQTTRRTDDLPLRINNNKQETKGKNRKQNKAIS